MSEYVIPLGMIPETLEELGAYIFDAYKWRGIVRCRDCKHYEPYRTDHHGTMYRCIDEHGNSHRRGPDGFCAWGEHKWLTCKCGHEMESEGKCPMCGRWVHE